MTVQDNIKIRKPNVTVKDGYYYTFDDDQDALLQKTDDGNTAFSYPCDNILEEEITSLEFDGVYFWSLEQKEAVSPAAWVQYVYIKKWKIDNYVCKLQDTLTLTSDASHKYRTEGFSVEHYHTSLSTTISGGETTIYLDKYYNQPLVISDAILHLGPNSSGEEEDVIVDVPVLGGVTLTAPVQYLYDAGDLVNFYKNIFLLNNFNGADAATGALYKFNNALDYVTKYPGGAYKDVKSATFSTIDSFTELGEVDTLLYTKGTNTLFVNVEAETRTYYDADTVDDSFTGSNDDPPNSTRWEITDGTPTIQSNQLELNPADTQVERVTSKYFLPGNFDVYVTGILDTYNTTFSGSGFFMNALTLEFPNEANRFCTISRAYSTEFSSGTELYHNFSSTARTATDDIIDITSATISGTEEIIDEYGLRLKRVGSDVFFYYRTVISGVTGVWNPLGNQTMYDTDAQLTVETHNFLGSGSITYNDNLTFTSGQIAYTSTATELPYYGSMVMDNVEDDEYTIDVVYDMSIDQNNMYRLHSKSGTYSYALSPLESFVTSISLSASPAVIAANGVSTSNIKAVVLDQFLQPITFRRVTFLEDGDGSITGGTQINTDSEGQSTTVYKAGTAAQDVQFTAIVEQTN